MKEMKIDVLTVDRIFFTLINTERNIDLLKKVPHRLWLDLAIVYRYAFDISEHKLEHQLVDNELCEHTKLDEKKLYHYAFHNTRKLLPSKISTIADELSGSTSFHHTVAASNMIILTNQYSTLGAANMLYSDQLSKISSLFDEDIYLFPSSIHECIAIPADIDLKFNLVKEINHTCVNEKEQLTDHIYYFDHNKKAISIYM